MSVRYEIDIHHQGGQIRRYGPDMADATIKIISENSVPTDKWFKRVFKKAVHDYVDEANDWYVFTLKEFRRIDDQTAYIRVERPYDD